MTKKQKQMAIRLVVSALFFAAGMFVEEKNRRVLDALFDLLSGSRI